MTSQSNTFLPYGRQWVDEEDIAAVVDVLRSDWLTTGPVVEEFEKVFAQSCGVGHAVAVSSGTAALHAAMHAIGITAGDEVIVPSMTFAATANCVVYCGGTPVFADVEPDTLLIDVQDAERKISPRTKAIVAVDYAGQPCDYDALRKLAHRRGLKLVADACHAVGGSYRSRAVGSLADVSTFSFHPVKHFTTGEGGAITTDDEVLAARMRIFRNHGILTDHRKRQEEGTWFYEMVEIGYNYRLTDFQCALGLSQLKRLPQWVQRRGELAQVYDRLFSGHRGISPLAVRKEVIHAYHLYVVRIDFARASFERADVFSSLRRHGIAANVHYIPVHLHPFYRERFGTRPGQCPVAEQAYSEILSLPMFPQMGPTDAERVVASLLEILGS